MLAWVGSSLLSLSLAALPVSATANGPVFTKVFTPDTIGPNSTSMLIFTIDNTGNPAASDLAFTDDLSVPEAGMTLAFPAIVSNSCDGILTAPNGGTMITFSGGKIGAGLTCTIVVNVTAGLIEGDTTYTNTSSALTSSLGPGGPATDDLMVVRSRPGFTKSFSPSTVALGGRSTLTFTIDNTENSSAVTSFAFVDNLPAGMVVASPANASTTCASSTLTAASGTSVVSLSASSPGVAASASCTVMVDVIGGTAGLLGNVSASLLIAGEALPGSGKAAAVLTVTGFTSPISLEKEFIDDPVAPGGTATLRFKVTNRDRDNAATSIAFTDVLPAGLTATPPPSPDPPCGAGSSLTGTTTLTFAGGSLPALSTCTFTVPVTVGAAGTYTNTTTTITADIGGDGVSGPVASDLLFVVSFPVLTKSFTDDPVGAGSMVTLSFTIQNSETTSKMSDIAFEDELTTFLPTPLSITLPPTPNPPCGTGSSLAEVSLGVSGKGLLLTGGKLNEKGMAGDSCTFSVNVTIPAGFPPGTYTNKTEPITATLDDVMGTPTVTGPGASDNLVVVGAPKLSKSFTNDPVAPGGTVTLEFTLTHSPGATATATAIGFTDDLAAVLPGAPDLTATLPPTPDPPCGVGSMLTGSAGDTSLTFANGSLAPGASCTFSVDVSVPAGAPSGIFTNDTSTVTATESGVSSIGNKATDQLVVSGFLLTKSFTDDPVIAGGSVVLSFKLDNTSGAVDATGISFTDSLSTVLPGTPDLGLVTSLPFAACGGTVSGSASSLSFSGGIVTAGTMCSFSVTLTVPAGTADGSYLNLTSDVTATIGSTTILPAATDRLVVNSELLQLTKSFTNDPAVPGGTVTLEFKLTNLDPANPASGIDFSDNLGDAGGTLSGLEAQSPALLNDCGGMASLPATTFSYAGGSLAGGATCTIRLSLKVPAGPLPGNVFPNITSGVTGTIGGLAVTGDPASDELQINFVTFTKSFADPVSAGTSVDLTFTITNLDGTNAVSGLAFLDNLAFLPGLTVTTLPAAGSCGAGSVFSGATALSMTGGSLAAGGMCTFTATLAVPAGAAPGAYVNTTGQLFSSGLAVAGVATDTLDVIQTADLSITKTDLVTTATPGGSVSYTIVASNSIGPSTATGVTVADTFPASLSGCSTTSVVAGGATGNEVGPSAGDINDSGITLPVGGSVTYTATCTISASATGTLDNTATISSAADTTPGNNSQTDSDTLGPAADLSITKTDSADPVIFGSPFSYTVTVTNNGGPSDASNVVVTDTLPTGTAFISTSGCTNDPGGVPSCSLGTIAAGSMKMFTINVSATEVGLLTNTASVTSSATETNPGGESASEPTTVDDGDGVDAAIEDAGPNSGDCNGDSIKDRLQPNVTAIPSIAGPYLCLITATGVAAHTPISAASALVVGAPDGGVLASTCNLQNVTVTAASSLLVDRELFVQVRSPLGLELANCSSATVTILYYGIPDLTGAVYRKFGKTLAQPVDHWYTLPGAAFDTTVVASVTVARATIQLTDGALGDHDLTVNNRIVDPGGAALLTAPIPTLSTWALMLMALTLAAGAIVVLRSRP